MVYCSTFKYSRLCTDLQLFAINIFLTTFYDQYNIILLKKSAGIYLELSTLT